MSFKENGRQLLTMFIEGINGNVGVGTSSPNSALQVSGYIQLDTNSTALLSTDCDASDEYGRMIVDSAASSSNLYVCTPNGWATFTP